MSDTNNLHLFIKGKVFLNTIEHLDPASDEWTTFVTVPEKSINSTKSLPLDVQMAEGTNETHTQHITINNLDQMVISKNTNEKENDDGIFFEMDLEPVENKVPSVDETRRVENNPSLNDNEIIQEANDNTPKASVECTTSLTEEQIVVRKNETISKHVVR